MRLRCVGDTATTSLAATSRQSFWNWSFWSGRELAKVRRTSQSKRFERWKIKSDLRGQIFHSKKVGCSRQSLRPWWMQHTRWIDARFLLNVHGAIPHEDAYDCTYSSDLRRSTQKRTLYRGGCGRLEDDNAHIIGTPFGRHIARTPHLPPSQIRQ